MTNTTMNFSHLHVHSHFSIHDGIAKIYELVDKAIACGMPAIALTDHGTMEGTPEFLGYCKRVNRLRKEEGLTPIKPIVGCEVYYGPRFYHLVLLAKNLTGYHNLCKIVSSGYHSENFYRDRPRIDFSLLEQLHEGIICSSACIGGEIPRLIMDAQSANPLRPDYSKAKDVLIRLKGIFGDDFYVEIQRSKTRKANGDKDVYRWQKQVNPVLINMAKEYNIPVIATNDPHFVNENDADAQDYKLCMVGQKQLDDPERLRFTRQEWFKSPDEMAKIFKDMPEVLSNTQLIVDKIEWYDITTKPQLPAFPLPESYDTASHYLIDLVLKGANERYKDTFTPEVTKRIKYELKVIREHNLSDYFLIIWDIIRAARERGIYVGPGRAAAAGSIVNYCLGITAVDPLRHGLLFERFLNPGLNKMPDIDIDFATNRRNEMVEYVRAKYGVEHVMHIITHSDFSETKAKKAIDFLGVKKNKRKAVSLLTDIVAQRGIHACGVAIAREPISEIVPTATMEDKTTHQRIPVTQYGGYYMEEMGLVKLDFLGLTTLNILNDTLQLIKEKYGQDLDLSRIPLDDEATIQLFRSGDTTGVFTFEGSGIQRHLTEMSPDTFQDIMALHTVFYPGVMRKIPELCARKNGKKRIVYPAPVLEKFLKETYGLLIYQEQVIEIAHEVGKLSYADADKLGRALFCKKKQLVETLHLTFVAEGLNNNYDSEMLEQIWNLLKQDAAYTFQKSHAVSYMLVAYQCAYLKAHYREEYMQSYNAINN